MRNCFCFMFFFISMVSFSQKKYKWPYFGNEIPPYIGITAGYEGFKANYLTAGLAINMNYVTVNPAIGGMAGTVISYKHNLQHPGLYSLESDLGFFGGLCMGVGLNYNKVTNNEIYGIKPLIGIAFYNVNIYYGYNFYANKMDALKELDHNRFTLRYIIPVLKLTKKTKKEVQKM